MAISACHENVREAMEETRGERKGDNKDEQERRRPMWKPQEESWAALVKKQAQGDTAMQADVPVKLPTRDKLNQAIKNDTKGSYLCGSQTRGKN